jgi:hypothetical protein
MAERRKLRVALLRDCVARMGDVALLTLLGTAALIFGIAILYLGRPQTAVGIYVLSIPVFPFYWSPFTLVGLNDVTLLRLLAIGMAVGLVLQTWKSMMTQSLRVRRVAVEVGVGILIIFWSISTFDVVTTTAAVRNLLYNFTDYWVPFVIAWRLAREPRAVREVLRTIAIPGIIVAAVAVYEYLSQFPIVYSFYSDLHSTAGSLNWNPSLRAGLLRTQVSFGQPIFLAFYLVACGLVLIVLGSTAGRLRRVAAYIGAVGVFLVSILPLARGAMVGLVAGLALLIVIAGGRTRRHLLVLLAIGLATIWISSGFLERTNSFLADFILTVTGQAPIKVQAEQLANFNGRVDVVQVGLDLIQQSPPLGYGDLSVAGTAPIRDVANAFIQVGLISGPIGLGLFTIFLIVVAIRLFRARLAESEPSRVAMLNGIAALFVLSLVCWADSSWPGQLVQIQFMTLGLASGWVSPASVGLVRSRSSRVVQTQPARQLQVNQAKAWS